VIVCICSNVSDKKIKQAISDGARRISDLRFELGVANRCGKCIPCAQQMLVQAAQGTSFAPSSNSALSLLSGRPESDSV
jgi:bacterioferritin-associated ferredoxin